MEGLRLFRFQRLQFFLFAKLASDIAERNLRSFGICVEACRRILRGRGRAIIFLRTFVSLGFDFGAVFRSEDAGMLEIFSRVNVPGAFPYFLFAGAFLTCGFGDLLILLVLGARNGCAEGCTAQKNNGGCGETDRTRDSPQAWASRLERHGAV